MPNRRFALVATAALAAPLLLAAALGAPAADAERGRALYELRCGGCHSESVHRRAKRVAGDFDDVRRWVDRWNETLALRWTGEEVDDVSLYLNGKYYRYPCPPRVCKVISLATPAR